MGTPGDDAAAWRALWRRRGMALDRMLPFCFAQPAPPLDGIRALVPKAVVLPDGGRQRIDEVDAQIVVRSAVAVVGHIAAYMPAQVTCTDLKASARQASQLAVRGASGEREYIGGFDLLVRVFASRSGAWQPYNLQEVALDVKLTGVDQPLGLNGATMRSYVVHGRQLLLEARRSRSRVGACRAAAWLVVRPPGPTFTGGAHRGWVGLVVFDAERLLSWDPKSRLAPPHAILQGGVLRAGVLPEPLGAPPAPRRAPPARIDRWSQLSARAVRGRVRLQDFVDVFRIGGRQEARKTATKVGKRLRDEGFETPTAAARGFVGQPPKMARVADLKHCYLALR